MSIRIKNQSFHAIKKAFDELNGSLEIELKVKSMNYITN